ncbi:MAG: FAD-dependent oxidoreductase [Rickettsiaceae bacterium]|nr:FAD-dependent oxidoreductase [Rickettsiaceae bacterium]
MTRVAIIGAGISGIFLAHELSRKAHVVVFEKARGVGGRMSTRYADPFYFDHGAQCFTARNSDFQDFLKPFVACGKVSEWKGRVINLQIEEKKKTSDSGMNLI